MYNALIRTKEHCKENSSVNLVWIKPCKIKSIEEKEMEQVTKKKPRGKSFQTGIDPRRNTTPVLPEGTVANYGKFFLQAWNLPKVNTNNYDEVEDRMLLYFSKCVENDMKPGVEGLCYFLGIDRQTFYAWSNGLQRNNDPRYRDLCKKAKAFLAGLMEEYMQNGKINPVSGIFLLKNHFGYTDKQEIVVAGQDPLGEMGNEQEIAERYREAVVEDQ